MLRERENNAYIINILPLVRLHIFLLVTRVRKRHLIRINTRNTTTKKKKKKKKKKQTP